MILPAVAAAVTVAVSVAVAFAAGAPPSRHPVACGGPRSPGALERAIDPALVDVDVDLAGGHGFAAGTGMVLTATGEVLTNNHVIDGASAITAVDVGNHRRYRVRVVGYDVGADAALLQLEGARHLRWVSFGDSGALTVGTPVAVIGNAGGAGGTPSCSTGRVTGLHRTVTASEESSGLSERLTDLIRTDAPVLFGESGGPLVVAGAAVVGMVTATTGEGAGAGGGYAIPAARARAVAERIEHGRASPQVHIGPTASLGVQVEALPSTGPSRQVVVVLAVPEAGGAHAAGLRPGDVLLSLDGRAVTSPFGLQLLLQRHRPGTPARVTWRDGYGRTRTATLILVTGPPA